MLFQDSTLFKAGKILVVSIPTEMLNEQDLGSPGVIYEQDYIIILPRSFFPLTFRKLENWEASGPTIAPNIIPF